MPDTPARARPVRPWRPVRSALLFLFRRIVGIYFRDIEVAGEVPSKDTGGRLFAANHVNALVDPILVLTQAPCDISPIAKSTLWKIPGLRWLLEAADAVPIVRRRDVPGKSAEDNEAVFERVATHLGTGGNILIFPEGTSHNEPRLLALRSGAGRMLARARTSSASLTFQAVALEFDARDVFRSRSLLLFGPVRHVNDLAREGAAPEDVATAITEALRSDLSELLVEGGTWDERLLIVRVAEMFANESRERSLEQLNLFGRRIEDARRVLATTDPETVHAIEERLRAYFGKLTAEDIDDAVVAKIAHGGRNDRGADRVARAAAMVLALPLAVLAVLLYYVPYQLPRFVTRKLGDDPDVASTYKLGVGLVVYPVWAGLLLVLAFLRLPSALGIVAGIVIVACPFAALPWLDRWDRLAGRLSVLVPSEQRRERIEALARERSELMRALEAARDRVDASATGASA